MPSVIIAILRYLAISTAIKFAAIFAIGIVSYAGYTAVVDQITTTVVTSYQGLPSDVLILLNISGVTNGLGIILGALSMRAAFIFTARWMPVTS
jgi:hypothetical protein